MEAARCVVQLRRWDGGRLRLPNEREGHFQGVSGEGRAKSQMKKPRPRGGPGAFTLIPLHGIGNRARGVPVAGVTRKPSQRTGKVLGCPGLVRDSSLVAIRVVH